MINITPQNLLSVMHNPYYIYPRYICIYNYICTGSNSSSCGNRGLVSEEVMEGKERERKSTMVLVTSIRLKRGSIALISMQGFSQSTTKAGGGGILSPTTATLVQRL